MTSCQQIQFYFSSFIHLKFGSIEKINITRSFPCSNVDFLFYLQCNLHARHYVFSLEINPRYSVFMVDLGKYCLLFQMTKCFHLVWKTLRLKSIVDSQVQSHNKPFINYYKETKISEEFLSFIQFILKHLKNSFSAFQL